MTPRKVAIIGCGARGRDHILAYEHIDSASVVACCAPGGKRRRKVAAEFGISDYADAKQMIEAERPDMVHIATWPDCRVEPMTIVSDMQVPLCTVEKPIAMGVGDWRALCALEQRTKTKFAVCHQCRWQPYVVKCQEEIQSGRLGDLKLLDLSAGMNISGQGTHILNYGMSLNSDRPVVRVFGTAAGASELDTPHPAPDSTIAELTFDNDVRALWRNGPTAPKCGPSDVCWQHLRFAAYADKGRVNYEEFGRWQVVSPDGVEGGDFGDMDQWQKNNILAQAGFHKAMFDWLEDDAKAPGTNLAQSLHEWKVVLALYESSLRRMPIEIADFDPPADLLDQLASALKQ